MNQTIKNLSPARPKISSMAIVFLVCLFTLLHSCKKEMDTSVDSASSTQQLAKGNVKMVDVELITDGLTSPVAVVSASKEDRRLFIVDQI